MENKASDWSRKSPSYWLSAAGGAFLLWLGVNGMARPEAAAEGFGLPLSDAKDRDYVRVKADRDIAAGLTVFALVALKLRKATQIFMLVCALEPLIDAVLVTTSPKLTTATKTKRVPVHLGALIYTLLTVLALREKQA